MHDPGDGRAGAVASRPARRYRDVAELLERADAEMYRVKASGNPGDAPMLSTAPRRRSEDKTKRPW